ncbi:MAG: phosphopyruvate hydratase [Candidatus Colwellbacteria bacterium CG10_big_fil_rev_8_21_14_0_10_42_22]|uniref:Enolase n=1 Tax=Candidatus Colwellbacteria bacterium CG10_big_fil_rev_8_21_14_0_10_42_22 TaxID=1974540 RepID=A0A2H0VFP0_9BACT|nr:MAG: phosphopyruvate hydratase [Candidatus Colwellbacteria bacterium CG10_big_fil_rev_8_21_14_0_10_42_22]
MAKISDIKASKILNSRDDWTIEVELFLDDGVSVKASVPEGKSDGSHEAVSADVETAIYNIHKEILPTLRGLEVSDHLALDNKLIELDGTNNKSRLGANAILAVSIASFRASAQSRDKPIWRYIKEVSGLQSFGSTKIYANLINGGKHAGNNLDIQEYLVIPKTENIKEAADIISRIYHNLGTICIEKYGESATLVGDEGGYAPSLDNNLIPLKLIKEAAGDFEIDLGIDAAASGINMSKEKLMKIYREMVSAYNLFYLEDPFNEEDFPAFKEALLEFGEEVVVTGDDLTVTNTERMRIAKNHKSINGIIIKPNQIGTVSEAIRAVQKAREYGWSVIVSHRSGETNDDFIADFAVGVGADGAKIGAPARGERIAKYNRLLKIDEEK